MEALDALKQIPWQYYVGMVSLIPLCILDIKFFAKKKVGLEKKIAIAKERGHVTRGMIVKEEGYRLRTNNSLSKSNYWGAHYTYTVKGKEYRKKFSSDPRTSTGPKIRTLINVYWIDNPNKPFWDYSEDPIGNWYRIFTTLFPFAAMFVIIWLLGGFDASNARIGK